MMKKITISLLFLFIIFSTVAQVSVVVKGKITDGDDHPVSNASVLQLGTNNGSTSNAKGFYSLEVEYEDSCIIEFSSVEFGKKTIVLYPTNKATLFKDIEFKSKENVIDTVEINATRSKVGESTINAKSAEYFPNPTNDVGTVVKTMGQGVQSNNELTGQYSVRGGNYDENLVYVNDFEIYRPFLVSSGQQEGLSFTNLDMTDKLSFSGGGFEAKYGDKMSSVLNISYKTPTKFHGSVMASILGVNAEVEGAVKSKKDSTNDNAKFTYLIGARYK